MVGFKVASNEPEQMGHWTVFAMIRLRMELLKLPRTMRALAGSVPNAGEQRQHRREWKCAKPRNDHKFPHNRHSNVSRTPGWQSTIMDQMPNGIPRRQQQLPTLMMARMLPIMLKT